MVMLILENFLVVSAGRMGASAHGDGRGRAFIIGEAVGAAGKKQADVVIPYEKSFRAAISSNRGCTDETEIYIGYRGLGFPGETLI